MAQAQYGYGQATTAENVYGQQPQYGAANQAQQADAYGQQQAYANHAYAQQQSGQQLQQPVQQQQGQYLAQQQQQQQQQYQQQQDPAQAVATWKQWMRTESFYNGVDMSWNVWPSSRIEPARLVVPFAAMYTPLHNVDTEYVRIINSDALFCSKPGCKAVINQHCEVNYQAKYWMCCICNVRNGLPPHYAAYNEQNKPLELQSATVEYAQQRAPSMPPIYLLCVDTCVEKDDLDALKETLTRTLSNLPSNALVGLITFGRTVQVHELSAPFMPRCYVFRGTKDLTAKQVQTMLGIGVQGHSAQPQQFSAPGAPGVMQPSQQQPAHAASRFIQPYAACESDFLALINQIQRNPWHTPVGKRKLRCIGAAVSIAVSMLEVSYPKYGARVLLFIGGPCNQGPGQVVSDDLKEPIRAHHDIEKDNVPFLKKANKFYEALAHRAAVNGHCIELFSCALDQTGLLEMKPLPALTGGSMLLADSFTGNLFKNSLVHFFTRGGQDANMQDLGLAFNAVLDLRCSADVKIAGCIGHCFSTELKSPSVADNQLFATGGTCQWKMNGLSRKSTFAFFFDITKQHQEGAGGMAAMQSASARNLYIQFITTYQHSSGMRRMRVTTVARPWAEPSSPNVALAFDQDAAAAIMARLVAHRIDSGDPAAEVQRWLDRSLIRLCQKVGTYTANEARSVQVPLQFEVFPKYMFHLRRSPFIQVFNNSPDETTFYRSCLLRENVINTLYMICPSLWCFSMGEAPRAVELDSSSIQPDKVLLLDTFFHVLVYHGETVHAWIKAGYHQSGQYPQLAEMMEVAMKEAQRIVMSRFPCPRYIVTEHGGSQARFLLSKVNPSQSHTAASASTNNMYGGQMGGVQQAAAGAVLTDDVNFETFFDHLRKLTVSSSS